MENILKHITEEAKKRGHEVRIRDIAYALMKVKFNDELIAYTVAFGVPEKDNDVKCYTKLDSTKYLVRWFEKDLAPKNDKKNDAEIIKAFTQKKSDDADNGSMSFEENRAGIEKQIAEILELKKLCTWVEENGKEITDVKTLATLHKTEADLRAKLNDKFGASEKSSEQYIIVQPKYDTVCPHTRRECYQMTKERAMAMYNLVEKQ